MAEKDGEDSAVASEEGRTAELNETAEDEVHGVIENPKDGIAGPKGNHIGLILVVVLTVLNAGLAGVGAIIVNDALDHKKEAEKFAKQASNEADAAKESYNIVVKTVKSSYLRHDLQLKRQVLQWFVELPGLELPGRTKDANLESFRRGLAAVEALEQHVPAEERTKTKHFIDAFLEFNSHQFDMAIESLQKFPDEIPEKYLLLGSAHARSGDNQQARWAFKRAQALSQRTRTNTIMAKSLMDEGITWAVDKQYKVAERLFRDALKMDPELYAVHGNFAALYSETGRFVTFGVRAKF